jgi:hypothetical protein
MVSKNLPPKNKFCNLAISTTVIISFSNFGNRIPKEQVKWEIQKDRIQRQQKGNIQKKKNKKEPQQCCSSVKPSTMKNSWTHYENLLVF